MVEGLRVEEDGVLQADTGDRGNGTDDDNGFHGLGPSSDNILLLLLIRIRVRDGDSLHIL
jgi:hypothetical protein